MQAHRNTTRTTADEHLANATYLIEEAAFGLEGYELRTEAGHAVEAIRHCLEGFVPLLAEEAELRKAQRAKLVRVK